MVFTTDLMTFYAILTRQFRMNFAAWPTMGISAAFMALAGGLAAVTAGTGGDGIFDRGHKADHVIGHPCFKAQRLARHRMIKTKPRGMQGLTFKIPHRGKAAARHIVGHLAAAQGAPIDWVADDPMANMRHMDPDLMGAACFKPAFDEAGERRQLAQPCPVGGGEAAIWHNRLLFAVTV